MASPLDRAPSGAKGPQAAAIISPAEQNPTVRAETDQIERAKDAKPKIWRRLQDFLGSSQVKTCLLFLPPGLLLFTLFVTWPVVEAAYYSFFNWNGYGAPSKWVGLDNFMRVWNDPIFYHSLFNNLLIVLVSAFIQVPLALALALLISDKSRSSVVFRAIFFLPYILGEIVAGLIWRYMYDGNYGVVAVVYRWFGQEAPQVLATEGWATAALLLVIVWKYFGFHMALFVAGRQGIGDDVLEAAKIDGASRWQTTRNIVLPLMRPVAVLSLFFSILGSLQAFAIIVALTDGGPSNSTHSAVSYLYNFGIKRMRVGLWKRNRGVAVRYLRVGDGHLQTPFHAPKGGAIGLCNQIVPVCLSTIAGWHSCWLRDSVCYRFGRRSIGGFQVTGRLAHQRLRAASRVAVRQLRVDRHERPLLADAGQLGFHRPGDRGLTLLVSSMAAFVLAHLRFAGKRWLANYLALGLTFPFATAVLPVFIRVRDLGLLDSYWGVILPQIAFNLGFAIVLLQGFFAELPNELFEAAFVDGCSYPRMFWQITIAIVPADPRHGGGAVPGRKLERIFAALSDDQQRGTLSLAIGHHAVPGPVRNRLGQGAGLREPDLGAGGHLLSSWPRNTSSPASLRAR